MQTFKHCRNCTTERYPGCHETCEFYRDDKAEQQELKKKQYADREIRSYVSMKNEAAAERDARKKSGKGYKYAKPFRNRKDI